MSHRAFDGYTASQTAPGVDGYNTIIRAQSASGIGANGGDLILKAGEGNNRDGYIRLSVDGYDRIVVGANGSVIVATTLTATAVTTTTLTATNLTADDIFFDGYNTSPSISQNAMPTAGVDGYHLLIKAQNSTTNPASGGNLVLQGGDGYNGDGYFRDGYVRLLSGATEGARIIHNKIHLLAGQRINLADIGTTPFDVPDGYFTMMVDTSTIAITINLPSNPVKGDLYQVKDSAGNAVTNPITVSGNGHNIQGSATYPINTAGYPSALFVYGGTQWSVL